MKRFYSALTVILICLTANAQTPGFYFGPRVAIGQTHFTQLQGFMDGAAVQLGVSSNKQFTQQFALQFNPYV